MFLDNRINTWCLLVGLVSSVQLADLEPMFLAPSESRSSPGGGSLCSFGKLDEQTAKVHIPLVAKAPFWRLDHTRAILP